MITSNKQCISTSVTDNAILLLTNSLDYHLDALKESIDKLESVSSLFLKTTNSGDSCDESAAGVLSSRSNLAIILEALITKSINLDESVQSLIRRVDV